MPSHQPIELDGRHLEGGGQLVRLAVCLSALTGTPIRITHIRGNRPKNGGLKPQHLACVLWLAKACNATVIGAEKGSQTLDFRPGAIQGGLSSQFKCERLSEGEGGGLAYTCRFDVGSAGATTLGLQAILPYIVFSSFPKRLPVRLMLTGGTNVSFSPSVDYIQHVLQPTLHAIGVTIKMTGLPRRGWSTGSKGLGEWTLLIPPRETISLPAFSLQTRPVTQESIPLHIKATFLAPTEAHSLLKEPLIAALSQAFKGQYTPERSNLTIQCEDSGDKSRLYLLLTATCPLISPEDPSHSSEARLSKLSISTGTKRTYTLCCDYLGSYTSRKSSAPPKDMLSKVVDHVVRHLVIEWRSGSCADEHMLDQLVVFSALAQGRSLVDPGWEVDGNGSSDLAVERETSLHTRTAEWVARQILGKEVRFEAGGWCEGIGFGDGNAPVEAN